MSATITTINITNKAGNLMSIVFVMSIKKLGSIYVV